MGPRLIPYVEITTRPLKGIKRNTPSSANSSVSRKRIRQSDKIPDRDTTDNPLDDEAERLGRHSPTVSDFNITLGDCLRASPTVSDFVTSGTSGAGFTYVIMDDELAEDDDLIISGETPLTTDDSQDDIPIRSLQDFTVYATATNEVAHVVELLFLDHQNSIFGASGLVKPWIDEEDDEEDDDDSKSDDNDTQLDVGSEERVKLSRILEFNIHDFSEEKNRIDSKIYIRTKYAWYILGMPSTAYKPFFDPFWIQHRILHLVLTASLNAPRITYERFLDVLDTDEESVAVANSFLGRRLTRQDVESDSVKSYISMILPDICAENEVRISHVPLIKSFLAFLVDYSEHVDTRHKPKILRRGQPLRKKKIGDKEKELLRHRATTVITPIVSRIAKNLFNGSLEVAGTDVIDFDECVAMEIDNIQSHHSDPTSMQWGEETVKGYYQSVIMDGVTYDVGNDVMINPGADEDTVRAYNAASDASQSTNLYANQLWFCRICYFFEQTDGKKTVKMFHGQWFTHGSKTILQETAHSGSVYLTNRCDNNPVASIFKKCNIKMLLPEDDEPLDDLQPDSNNFHCGLVWSDSDGDFTNLPKSEDIGHLFSPLPSHKPCVACGLKYKEGQHAKLQKIPGGFTQYGVKYHVLDFIYIRPLDSVGILGIAQITQVEGIPDNPKISVRHLGRYDDYVLAQKKTKPSSTLASDERRLYISATTKDVPPDQIDGICYVQYLTDQDEIEQWVKNDDHFYLNQKGVENLLVPISADDFESCRICYYKRHRQLHSAGRLRYQNEPLRGLELFSGAGGLGTGMEMSGFVETGYAVEFSPSAAATYQVNHPKTVVYCQDSSLLLKHAIETEGGKNPGPLPSNHTNTPCPPMPKRNEVDFIFGGPPCQSFSLANHHRHPDDIRSTLPGNMLSYVEHYNPQYFLLENVKGLIDYPLMSTSVKSGRGLEGGIKSGVVKFITRALIALGYQVRFKLLQAGQYGAPQGRHRVIFWGAKRGLRIPDFPVPQYAFPKGVYRCKLPTGEYMQPVSRSPAPYNYHQCAPFRPITVNDAIDDLPPFEWINPHVTIPTKPHNRREALARSKNFRILEFDAVIEKKCSGQRKDLPGFPDGTAYRTMPMNRYQTWIRQGMAGEEDGEKSLVHGHYTKRFGVNLVEATVTVPLRPWADHRDLPLSLQPNHAKPGAKQAKKSFYGRMDGRGHFKCAMTQVAPNIKQSWLLHPSQKRIISVRECARAQGFPDCYTFKSSDTASQKVVDNQIRQIGNAVPVPLSLALGKSLGEALVTEWAKKEREGSPII